MKGLRDLEMEAMAHAMPVIAARDPRVSVLADGVTARLVDGLQAPQWERAVHDLLSDPGGARGLGASARAHVREHNRASAHVRSVLNAYNSISSSKV